MCIHEENKDELYLELTTDEIEYIQNGMDELARKVQAECGGMRKLIENIINGFPERQREVINEHVSSMVKEMGKKKISKQIQQIEEKIEQIPTLEKIREVAAEEVKERLDKLEKERNNFKVEKAQLEENFNKKLNETLEEKEKELNAKHEKERESLESALKEERNKISEKDKIIGELEGKLKKYENDLSDETENLQKLNNELNAWKELASHYEPLNEAMKNCSTFAGLISEKKIEKISDLIKAIGETIDFAKAVHQCAKDEKKKQNEPEPITEAEKQVYRAINACYKYIWQIEFDIFVLPGRKSIDEEFTKTDFDRNEVENMQNPKDKSCKFTQQVYVPMLLARHNSVYASAQVKAGNN